MNKKLKGRIINIIVVVAYLIMVGLLAFNIYGFSDKYNQEELNMIVRTEKAMKEALEESSYASIGTALQAAQEEHEFDIVVTDMGSDEIIYASIPYSKGDTLLERVRPSVVAKESAGLFEASDGTQLTVWYAVYKLTDSAFVSSFLQSIVITTILATVLIALTIIMIYRTLFDPLKNIEKSIELAEDYQFDDISEEDDNVNKSFKRFTSKLQDNISAVSRKHTELEKRLQSKQEHLNNTIVVSRSMVHDLKTPVHQNMIENEIAKRDSKNDELIQLASKNEEMNHELMMEINTILKMLKSERTLAEEEKSDVDAVLLIEKSIRRFIASIKEKDLSINLDTPSSVMLNIEEPALILLVNNLISNMVQYSAIDTELYISVDELDHKTSFVFENEASDTDIERMKKTEQLFNVVEQKEDETHKYSSGNGLYLIKDLTHILGGTYSITTNNNKVRIEVSFTNG